MSKRFLVIGLSMAFLMVGATLASAQPPAKTEDQTARKGALFPGLKLEHWDDGPDAQPTKPATASATPRKRGLPSFRLEPWDQKTGAEPAKPKVASANAKKTGPFAGFRLQPWHEDEVKTKAKAEQSQSQAVDEDGKPVGFPGLKLEPWR